MAHLQNVTIKNCVQKLQHADNIEYITIPPQAIWALAKSHVCSATVFCANNATANVDTHQVCYPGVIERSQECLLSCCTLQVKQSGRTIGWHTTVSAAQLPKASENIISQDGRTCARAEAAVSRLISMATDGAKTQINDANAHLNA